MEKPDLKGRASVNTMKSLDLKGRVFVNTVEKLQLGWVNLGPT